MTDVLQITRHDAIAVVEINNPPVNALGPGVSEAVANAVDELGAVPAVRAIVVRGAGRFFAAGADISRLERAAWGDDAAAPDWHVVFRRIEDCQRPVVMAIHGAALGGGLELAMAGHYRVATADAQLGQPEVNLGLIPGGEGTQRLPRLAGIETTLEMCVTGRPISVREAAARGIVDAIVQDDLTASAVAFAAQVADRAPTKTRDRRDRLGQAAANAPLIAAARERAATVRPHEEAPLRAIAAIEAAAVLPFDEGCRRERDLFRECLRSDQARAMIYVFFAERAAAKGAAKATHEKLGQRLKAASHRALDALASQSTEPDAIVRALAAFGVSVEALGWPAAGTNRAAGSVGGASLAADPEIFERYVYALVNEGARALEDGAADRASDVDVAALSGCGFPRWRGGPLFHADGVGLARVRDRIAALERSSASDWTPAGLLSELARTGRTFRDRDRAQPRT